MKRETEHLENLIRVNDPNSGKEILKELDRIEQKFKDYRYFLSRGGFIKDRNGKWCKEGDRISYTNNNETWYGELKWNSVNGELLLDKDGFFTDYRSVPFCRVELIKPCEPDICKDFEEESE